MTEHLPHLTSDASRQARTIAKCHDTLAARRRRIEARKGQPHPTLVAAERLLMAGACAAYLVAMAGNVFAIAGPR